MSKNLRILYLPQYAANCAMLLCFSFLCSGFGFVTYRTVEAAKKAIDDPQKTLGVSDDKPYAYW